MTTIAIVQSLVRESVIMHAIAFFAAADVDDIEPVGAADADVAADGEPLADAEAVAESALVGDGVCSARFAQEFSG